MVISIKDPETDRLAREYADLIRQPITSAVRMSLQDSIDRWRTQSARPAKPNLALIIERGRARRTLDHRSDDDILGYDTDGLPA